MVVLIMVICAIFAVLAGGLLSLTALLVITAIGGFVVWRACRGKWQVDGGF